MLSYLSAETNFIRAFGNRSLLLIFLCALTRTGDSSEKASAFGVSINLNPGLIAVVGPVLALLLLISLKVEADALLLAREVVLEEATKLNRNAVKISRWVYLLFVVPSLSAIFMTLQFILKLVPLKSCGDWNWVKQFSDFSYSSGTPSTWCIHDLSDGTPWIYPPFQGYIYVACVAACIYLTYRISKAWPQSRALK